MTGRPPSTPDAAPSPTATSPGRDDQLRDRLLDHTLRVLLADGYQRFSMGAVAASARASKETLYRHFGDRAGLLQAALERTAGLIEPLLRDGLDDAPDRHERLRRLGRNYLRGCSLPESLALQRLAVTDGGLGPIFARAITERAVDVVESEFAAIGSPSPRADAETFLGMVQGRLHERVMLGEHLDDLDRRAADQVDHAVLVIEAYLDAAPRPR